MKRPEDQTNGELIKRAESLQKSMMKLTDKFIEQGLGDLRPSDMRKRPDCKLSSQYVEMLDQYGSIRAEAERRYGPDLRSIDQLKNLKRR